MSHQAVNWAYEQNVHPSARKFVLVTVANFADGEGRAFPGAQTLATMTGQEERSVRRHLEALEEAGLIRREHRRRADGSRTTDDLWLLAPPEALRPHGKAVRKGKGAPEQADNLSGSQADLQADILSGGQADNLTGPTGQSDRAYRTNCQGLPDNLSGHEPSDDPSVVVVSQTTTGQNGRRNEQRGKALAALVAAFRPWSAQDLLGEHESRERWLTLTPARIRELRDDAFKEHGNRYRGDLIGALDAEVREPTTDEPKTAPVSVSADEDMDALLRSAPLEGAGARRRP